MSSKKITDCVPALQLLWFKLQEGSKLININIILTCTARTEVEQQALYIQGRESLDVVNSFRKKAGLWLLIENENKYKITWTLDSKHIIGIKRKQSEAFDIAVLTGRKVTWDIKADINGDEVPDYIQVANIGRNLGLRCGADFKNPDYSHYEIKI
jgi:hypothetical protein